jgi:hypothetical protein
MVRRPTQGMLRHAQERSPSAPVKAAVAHVRRLKRNQRMRKLILVVFSIDRCAVLDAGRHSDVASDFEGGRKMNGRSHFSRYIAKIQCLQYCYYLRCFKSHLGCFEAHPSHPEDSIATDFYLQSKTDLSLLCCTTKEQ